MKIDARTLPELHQLRFIDVVVATEIWIKGLRYLLPPFDVYEKFVSPGHYVSKIGVSVLIKTNRVSGKMFYLFSCYRELAESHGSDVP